MMMKTRTSSISPLLLLNEDTGLATRENGDYLAPRPLEGKERPCLVVEA